MLPIMIEDTGIDMWIIIDQVSWTLVGGMHRGQTAVRFLVLYNRGNNRGVERIRGGFGRIHQIVEE